jgi:hypothetical protein
VAEVVQHPAAVTLNASDAPAWSQFVRDFDGAYKGFNDSRAGLIRVGPYVQAKHPELLAQYNDLLTRANALQPKLQMLADTRARVAGWLGTLQHVYQTAVDATSQAIETAADWIAAARKRLGLGELGVAPVLVVIGVGAAAAGLALITKWISDTYMFAKRLNAMQDMESRGYSPEQSADAVNRVLGKPGEGGIEQTISRMLWIAGLAAIGLWVLPKVLELMGSRKAG